MTSVSSTGWGTGIQSLLQRQVTSGAIPQGDQSALSSAINDIGGALGSGTSTSGSIQDRVSGLIDNEVSNGKLTGNQATELKGLFANKAHAHMRHAHGAGDSSALNDLLSPDGTTNADGTTSTTSTDPLTSAANGAHSVIDGLASFVSSLRSAVSSNGLYGAGGSTAGRIGSVLVNSFA